jgi:MFS family permease
MSDQKSSSLTRIIGASSLGTMIEWYDFYIFGSLATVISTKFFPQDNPTAAFLSTLATFAAGFVVRPFGALFFGRLGDLIGRKYTFMVTLVLMGGATFLMGCIPSYESIGFLAPILVLVLRLLQGLALGGEYGGAATYVAEHSPLKKRGFMTSWIQTTATIGLFVSLLVIMGTRSMLSTEAFNDWGWRVPFWVSILLVILSYFIRKKMEESPVFEKAKAAGNIAKNPIKESFGKKQNFKFVLLALFGATMGQGVVWYTGQFYAMSFMEKTMNVDKEQVDSLLFIALICGTPFFVFFGWLSDKIGRKWIMMAGMLVAILAYRPIYESMYQTTNLANKSALIVNENKTSSLKITNEKNRDSIYVNTIAGALHLLRWLLNRWQLLATNHQKRHFQYGTASS